MYPGHEQYWTAIQQAPEQPLPMTGKLAHPAELTWSKFARLTSHYVLSGTLSSVTWAHTRILRRLDEVRELKDQAGKDIYLMGGAMLTSTLLNAGEAVTKRRALTLLHHHPLGEGRLHLSYQVG